MRTVRKLSRRFFFGAALFWLVLAGWNGARAEEDKVLNVYNWSDYIAEDTVAKFTAETGITVNYDVYDSNEALEAKLLAGKSGYDLVIPSATPFFAREIKAGAFRKLDKSRLKNLGNLDRQILDKAKLADPGNEYGVPYMWGTTGLGYNVEMVKDALGAEAPLDSLKLIFDPAVAEKLAPCGISLLDTAQEMFPAALAWLGRDPLSKDPKDLEKAAASVAAIRPFVKKFHSSQYLNDLANGDLCVSFGYSGDIVQARNRAREAKNGVAIAYSIPKEGAMMWIDMMAIPADAPHPDNAHRFIDFILRPEIAAAISNAIGYPNANAAATKLVDPAIRDDPGVYPPEEVRAKLFFDRPAAPDYERARTRAWTQVKSGS
jgi:putrescine transport system substrate-binding protein